MTTPEPMHRMPIDQAESTTAIAVIVAAVVLVGLWSLVAHRDAPTEHQPTEAQQKEAS